MKKFLIVLTVVAMSAFLLVGCNLGTTNTAPVITTTALPDATVGTAYTTTVVATDADNDALTFSLVSELTGMVISEAGVISGWTPAEAGTKAVTVAVTDGKDSVSADFTITVNVAEVAVTGVTLDKTTLALTVGGATGILVETVLPADAADLSVTWASSAPTVATVALGVVTPLTAGTANITVTTVDGGFTDTCVVTVSAVSAAVINIAAISGVTAPVTGYTPVTIINATDQYTGSVVWSPAGATFLTSTVYKATITLIPETGYTLTGVAEDFFTVAGAIVTSPNYADSPEIITATFPATAAAE